MATSATRSAAVRAPRRRLLPLAACIAALFSCCCCVLSVVSAATADASSAVDSAVNAASRVQETSNALPGHLHEQLKTLAHELQRRTQRAESERQALQTRMDSSQQLVTDLFANEREETELFVQETRLRMQALRDVMRVEMQSVLRDVQLQVQSAVKNVSALVQKRERVRREKEQQLARLMLEKQQKQREEEEERQEERRRQQEEEERQRQHANDGDVGRSEELLDASVQNESAAAIDESQIIPAKTPPAVVHEQIVHSSPTASANVSAGGSDIAGTWSESLQKLSALVSPLLESATSIFSTLCAHICWFFQNVLMPVVIVFGGVLLAMIAFVKIQRYRRARRNRGILYSGYLKPPSAAERQKKRQQQRQLRAAAGASGNSSQSTQGRARRRPLGVLPSARATASSAASASSLRSS